MDEKNNVNDTVTSNNKTMEYYNNVTKSIINQTTTEVDPDLNIEKEAFFLSKKAEKKLEKKSCLCSLCISKQVRFLEAIELFKSAGDKYRLCNQWQKAGICYENCSIIKLKLKQKPMNFYKQAYYCFSKIDIGNDSKRVFEKMNHYLEKEKAFFQIGKNYENLAIEKQNKKKYEEAITNYLKALEYYEKERNQESLKTNIKIKLSELMMLNDHPNAPNSVPEMLESIAINYLKKPITKMHAKDYFGKAILCNIYFKDNPSEGDIYIDKYKKIDKTFDDSNVCKLCHEVINSLNNKDYKKLNDCIQQYKEENEIDELMNDILNKIVEKEKSNNIRESTSNDNFTDEEDIK